MSRTAGSSPSKAAAAHWTRASHLQPSGKPFRRGPSRTEAFRAIDGTSARVALIRANPQFTARAGGSRGWQPSCDQHPAQPGSVGNFRTELGNLSTGAPSVLSRDTLVAAIGMGRSDRPPPYQKGDHMIPV